MVYTSRRGNSLGEGDALQKYMLLESQHEVIRRRLSLQLPSITRMTPASPEFQSLSSPPSGRTSVSSMWSPEPSYTSLYSAPTQPVPIQPGVAHRHSIDSSYSDDTRKSCEINQQIKATLTELLNTQSVRSDEKYRAWVQGRLMDAEHNIRRQRRHRSSDADREVAQTIAGSL
ncbi:hypothetical protein EJ04DRAFT_508733 [Polyplosphaeria fusca]|uniref:Uncharacterized protein n=1 Tax=Polyplosphaeria fusca TaxID=682080 RepID=A0A9P4R9Y3_9PLEO|nr:hypothetical protein EJ04DRAFT_508733 [Polyplosphaeria fusca]